MSRRAEILEEAAEVFTVYTVLGLSKSVHCWYRPGGRHSMRRIAEACADLALDGLRHRPAAG